MVCSPTGRQKSAYVSELSAYGVVGNADPPSRSHEISSEYSVFATMRTAIPTCEPSAQAAGVYLQSQATCQRGPLAIATRQLKGRLTLDCRQYCWDSG